MTSLWRGIAAGMGAMIERLHGANSMHSDCELNPYVPFCPALDYRRFAARRPDYGEIITDEHL